MTAGDTTTDERKAEYDAYLRSSTWQAKREVALERAGHRCQLWADHTGRLDVHHRSYERFGGAELPEDLIVLCQRCHKKFHGLDGKASKPTKKPRAPLVATEERDRMLATLPKYQYVTTHEAAAATGLTVQRAGSVLASLRKKGLVKRSKKRWALKGTPAHLAPAKPKRKVDRLGEENDRLHAVQVANREKRAASQVKAA